MSCDENKKTATFVKKIEGWIGDARLFRLSAPMSYDEDSEDENSKSETDHVIVSAVATFGDETFIFPATADGEVLNMCEMVGSFKGNLDHVQALRNAGYEIYADSSRPA